MLFRRIYWAFLTSLAITASLCFADHASSPTQEITVRDSIIDSAALNFAQGQFGTCINGQTFQIDAIVTHQGWQYATYFDGKARLAVARRQLPEGAWQTIAFEDYTIKHTDVHNVPVIGICPADGTIHLSFDHHCNDLRYRVSKVGAATKPEQTAWTAALFSPTTSELVSGQKLKNVTYPEFYNTPDGRLGLYYRLGYSGNGESYLALYDPAKGGWSLTGMFINSTGNFGESTTRNAYHNGFDYGPGGRLHTTWTWREGKDMGKWGLQNCHDLMYAYSDDDGRTWRNNDGQQIGVSGKEPMHVDSPKLRVREIAWHWGLMNQVTQIVDSKGRVHVVMWQLPPDAAAASKDMNLWRYFHYYRDEKGEWHTQRLPVFGRKPFLLADKNDDLILIFTKPENLVYHNTDPGGELHVYRAAAGDGWSQWRQVYRSEKVFVGEPRVDKARFRQEGVLSIYTQERPEAPGKASPLHVIDFLKVVR